MKIVVCGLGAVGLTFASKLNNSGGLKVLVDSDRYKKYLSQKPVLNGIAQDFDYILPKESEFKADVIFICTKFQGLESALDYITNFVAPETRIISLINGISSEDIIKKKYPEAVVLKSFFIGHSAVRQGNSVTQDGVAKIVCEYDIIIEELFKKCGIDYEFPSDIDYAMWLKYSLNLFSNQISAILKMTFGEMKNNRHFIEFAKKIVAEVKLIAEKKEIKNLENLEKDSLAALQTMCDDGKTSMLQDIMAGRKTEAEMFAGEIIRLGKIYGILTPYNQVLYDLIKIEEEHMEIL